MAANDVLADLTPESLAVVEKIGAEVVARRLELHDDFADFDRLRSRGITPEQFTRVLTLHRIALTPEEREALIRQFGWAAPTSGWVGAAAGRPPSRDSSPLPPSASSSAGVPVYVNYEAFLRSLKGCIARAKSAAGIPRGAPWTGETDPPTPLAFPEATEEAAQLNAVLHRLREVARSRGLHLVKAFTGMDPLRSGKVTTSQFTRCVENVFPQHLGLLLAPFSTASKRGGNAPPTAAGNETERGDGSGKDGKGNTANGWEIPSGKPRTMLDLLLRAYGDGNGKVRYLAWCRAVEGGKKEGPGTTSTAPLEADLAARSGVRNPHLSANELVGIIRAQFALYRLRGEDYFADFDPFKTGVVTAPQFESALGRLDFVKFSLAPENIETLIHAYAAEAEEETKSDGRNPAAGSPYRRVCYIRFLHDTNPRNFPSDHSPPLSARSNPTILENGAPINYFHQTHASNTFLSSPQESQEADRILEKVRRQVSTNRIFLTPVLRDMDRVRKSIAEHRICTAPRFARALATQKVMLPPPELALLIRKYTLPHADGSPSEDVHYYQFVVDVDPSQARGVPGSLSGLPGSREDGMAPSRPPFEAKAETDTKGQTDTTSETDAAALAAVLRRICLQAEERHLRVGEFFGDFDPLRRGRLAPGPFRTALTAAGVRLGADEFAHLTAAYAGSRRGEADLDIRAFLADLRDAERGMRRGGGATTLAAAAAREGRARARADFTAAERTQLAGLRRRLRAHVAASHAMLAPFFADFDRPRRGKLTRGNFHQALRRHAFPLTEGEAALLARYFASPTEPGMVEYRAFIAAIDEDAPDDDDDVMETTDRTPSRPSGEPHPSETDEGGRPKPAEVEADAGAVLARIAAFVRARRPDVGGFFPDGDELRHGRVSLPRFRHVVNVVGMTALAEAELRALEAAFADGDGVDYGAFLAALRARLAEEKKSTAAPPFSEPFPCTTGSESEGAGGEPGGLQRRYQEVVARIRRQLGGRRARALLAFREEDRARRGYLRAGVFFSCLAALLGSPPAPSEAATLTTTLSTGSGEIAYEGFCAAVEDAEPVCRRF